MSALLHAVGVRRGAGVAPGVGRRLGGIGRRIAKGVKGARGGISGRRRRHRGISGAELRGFKKVANLLSAFGMRPRGLAAPMHRRRARFGRRLRGDPEE